jgi:SAM-dependent methyltransferase
MTERSEDHAPRPRIVRRLSHLARVATTPRLWGEQVRYWQVGRSDPSDFPRSPWAVKLDADVAVLCNVCGWTGEAFEGARHVESQLCPRCGSNGRDRFLFLALQRRVDGRRNGLRVKRVLETSPRMGNAYRTAMRGWFEYTPSDFDLSLHRAAVQIDLQDIALPAQSLDLVLTPHVLEHVPATDKALRELWRVLARCGQMLLQVPILQGHTAPPTEPEFHDDNTPVFWRFGLDLADRLREVGFETDVLCTEPWFDAVARHQNRWPSAGEFDVSSILAASSPDRLVPIADAATANRLGLCEPYQFLIFDCRKP